MSRAMQSLSPAWVENKEAGITGIAPGHTGMYGFLADVDTGVELAATPEGYYTPATGNGVPVNAAGASGITASPATAWTAGSSIPTRGVDGVGGVMHWGGAAWADGAAT